MRCSGAKTTGILLGLAVVQFPNTPELNVPMAKHYISRVRSIIDELAGRRTAVMLVRAKRGGNWTKVGYAVILKPTESAAISAQLIRIRRAKFPRVMLKTRAARPVETWYVTR